MNYGAHVDEMRDILAPDPVFFIMPDTALLVNDKPFFYPDFSKQIEYETELVVKICRNGRSVEPRFARRYYAEVTVGIDLTARDLQKHCKEAGLPWEIAKGFDNAAPVGRFVPLPEGRSVQDLHFHLDINGKTVQEGWTGDMLTPVDQLIAHLSQYFTIRAGDLLFTGTPQGVGQVHIGDRLQAWLEDELLLDFRIC